MSGAESMTWACSVTAARQGAGPLDVDIRHTAFAVEASGRAAALGKAARVGRKIYPAAEGWAGLDAAVAPAAELADPD